MDHVSKREQMRFRHDREQTIPGIPDRGVEVRDYSPLNSQFTFYYGNQSNNGPETSHSQPQPQPRPRSEPQSERPGTPNPHHVERQADRIGQLEPAYQSLQQAYGALNRENGALKGTNVKLRQNLFVVKSELKETRDQNQQLKEGRREANNKMRVLEAMARIDRDSEEMEGFFNANRENTTNDGNQDNERYMSDVDLEDDNDERQGDGEGVDTESSTGMTISGAFSNLTITLRDGRDEMDISN